jgi:hypothetical protein
MQIRYIGDNIERVSDKKEDIVMFEEMTVDSIKLLKPLLAFLNPKDRDVLYLAFLSKKKQKDLEKIMKKRQSSLCYDIQQIRKRLKLIHKLHSMMDSFTYFIDGDAKQNFSDFERGVLTMMFYSTSNVVSCEVLGCSSTRVKDTFLKCLHRLEVLELKEMYDLFQLIYENMNIVKRVYKRKNVSLDEAVKC